MPTRTLALLAALYFVQGLPFGFQISALPLLLRAEGHTLTLVGLSGALSLPWMLKLLWAPLVDLNYSPRFGRRRSWIVPTQAALAATCLCAAYATACGSPLKVLLFLVAIMNLFAATLDIAVDGLAVDRLRPSELGYGNVAQVVFYKLGMLTGGGLLVWLADERGWAWLFSAMAALIVAVMIATFRFDEPQPKLDGDETTPGVRQLLRTLAGTLQRRGSALALVCIATYKIGESLSDAMFRPYLFDAGFSVAQIALWLSTWGMVFSLAGSVVGGRLASTRSIPSALLMIAVLRALPLGAMWWISLATPTAAQVIAVTSAEHFFGGALTTVMFAFMMSQVDRRIGATHYTALATLEVLGKAMTGWASGILAQSWGYSWVFASSTLLSAAFLIPAAILYGRRPPAGIATDRHGNGSHVRRTQGR